MTVAAVSSNLTNYIPSPQNDHRIEQFRQGFNELGNDLSTGNLSAARQDFASLPKPGENSTSQATSPIEQAFGQLARNLQSGNLTGANQDYARIQQDIQNRIAHRHHQGGGNPGPTQPAQPAPVTSPASGPLSVTA